jgi:DNA-binding protein H-NS
MNDQDLATMSIDELWELMGEVDAILSTRMEAEKQELERRLARLQGSIENKPRAHRPYPKVTKYRNPERPSETWSGRGNQPRWVAEQLRAGKKFEELVDRPLKSRP